MTRTVLVVAAMLLAGCASIVTLPSYGGVPDFSLVSANGSTFNSKEQLAGKVWVANFIFTTCNGPCPRMSTQMRDLQKTASEYVDARLVSFTVDPKRDTPEVLTAYAKRFAADPQRWFFLTGPQASLHNLSRNTFMLGDVSGQLDHSTRFVLVDRHGRIRGFYDSSDREKMKELERDFRLIARSDA